METDPSPATKSDVAYRLVRDRILSGDLVAGSVIHQRDLATRIGISTTPLREALRRLKSEGLVELDAHRDARVSMLRAEEARDLLEVRRSLDPLAAGLAAERRSRADLDAIREAHELLAPLRRRPSVDALAAHRRFHAAVYTASHNEVLVSMLDALWDKADRYRRLALEAERGEAAREATAREHELLVECVVAGDSAGAAQVMREHIETSLGATALRQLGRQGSTTD